MRRYMIENDLHHSAFWQWTGWAYRRFFTSISRLLLPVVVLFAGVALFPSNPAVQENGIAKQLQTVCFFAMSLYGLLLVCLLPGFLRSVCRNRRVRRFCRQHPVPAISCESTDLREAFDNSRVWKDEVWFLSCSGLQVFLMPKAYLKKISAIQTKRTQGRFAQTVYQAAVLTVTGTVETISFSDRAGRDAFVLWLRRMRRSESASKRPV